MSTRRRPAATIATTAALLWLAMSAVMCAVRLPAATQQVRAHRQVTGPAATVVALFVAASPMPLAG